MPHVATCQNCDAQLDFFDFDNWFNCNPDPLQNFPSLSEEDRDISPFDTTPASSLFMTESSSSEFPEEDEFLIESNQSPSPAASLYTDMAFEGPDSMSGFADTSAGPSNPVNIGRFAGQSKILALRDQAKLAGRISYDTFRAPLEAGQGHHSRSSIRKQGKRKSAYVSRCAAKRYERLLEQEVQRNDLTLPQQRHSVNLMRIEIANMSATYQLCCKAILSGTFKFDPCDAGASGSDFAELDENTENEYQPSFPASL